MFFDTITRRETCVEDNFEHRATIWAYRAFRRTFFREVAFKASSVTAITAVTAFGVYMIITIPYTTVNAANTHPKENAVQNNPQVDAPNKDKVSSPQPIAIEAVPVPKNIPRIVKTGGFESVYLQAEKKYGVSWQLLAAVHSVESGQSGDTDRTSVAGAIGPMQFMQKTFDSYSQDGDGDGEKSIYDVHDAIFTAAKHLAKNGALNGNVRGALYNYNHSYDYVDKVLQRAKEYGYNI